MRNIFLFFILIFCTTMSKAQSNIQYKEVGRSIVFTNASGEKLRLTPYGNQIIRVQKVRKNEDFFSDNQYEMVETHQWPGKFNVEDQLNSFSISTEEKKSIVVQVSKTTLQLSFWADKNSAPFLSDQEGIRWNGDTISTSFVHDPNEHFTGMGHGYYGREESIDLKDKIVLRNYGTQHGQQAPLIVPFYLSSKGYGVFLNSTFTNQFNFGKNGLYNFSIQGDGRMDYFVLLGPDFSTMLNLYTQLTGRPRLPLKAFFGLGLSDKVNDEHSSDPSDENWWKRKITEHRNAGFPLDHIINDNRWRAGGGQRCVSYFAWDSTRYPNPKEYADWVKKNGLILTIDFNRCIAEKSEGWKPSYNIKDNKGIDFNLSAPDFTKKEVREWFWTLMWKKSLDPAIGYPGDALWIDEFDEFGEAPDTMRFDNGTTWKEMKNYWFFLISKSLVQEGWDPYFHGTKRPFVWVRGMTAGAQRYATLWSGDIQSTYEDMKTQVRSLQLAGLSGFPFWGHDAGGFQKSGSNDNPNDLLYRQWSMAFGSFTTFWKPHGVGQSRWPLDRSLVVQEDAKKYCDLRYRMMPYIYTYAHQANETGMPVARAMVIDYPKDSIAWKSDLQYLWGKELLVAPNCSDSDNVAVWLPKGDWYDFWNDDKIVGDKIISYPAPTGKLPLFVKAGSIIPMANFALSTAMIQSDSLTIHLYPGKDATFTLYEDDGISEAYKLKNEKRTTVIKFNQSAFSLNIAAANGDYKNAPNERAYKIIIHGISKPLNFEVNGVSIKTNLSSEKNIESKESAYWDSVNKLITIYIPKTAVTKDVLVRREM